MMTSVRKSGKSAKSRTHGRRMIGVLVALVLLVMPALALAGRSGGSFGGRTGFRSGGGFSTPRTGTSYRYGGGGGTSFFFFPSFGWGYGGSGFGGFGSLLMLAALGITAYSVVRAVRRHRQMSGQGGGWGWGGDDDYEPMVRPDRAYVYRLQVALGRSARGIQDRLARFAAEGDTASEAGLASLLQQTALEIIREKDSIRYAGSEGSGPMSLTNAETKLNSLTLAERARFQVERVRAAEGKVRRSEAVAEEGKEALELVVVTVVVATRNPLGTWKAVTDRTELDGLLSQLGGVAQDKILGIEVIWTPADPNDSMTETDVMTTYPDLRSI